MSYLLHKAAAFLASFNSAASRIQKQKHCEAVTTLFVSSLKIGSICHMDTVVDDDPVIQ
jgi:hypothetical protein